MDTIGENIRRLRQQKGISQDRLSKESDLALNTIVKIETGDNPNPTVETLHSIAKALNVFVSSLFVLPLKSLKELEGQQLLKFSKSFGGSYSGLDIIHAGFNKLFLKRVEVTSGGDLKLTVGTQTKNGQSGHIRSDNKNLLKEIKNVLETMIGKTLSEVYHEKIIVYE